jgi:hypothetical protein
MLKRRSQVPLSMMPIVSPSTDSWKEEFSNQCLEELAQNEINEIQLYPHCKRQKQTKTLGFLLPKGMQGFEFNGTRHLDASGKVSIDSEIQV